MFEITTQFEDDTWAPMLNDIERRVADIRDALGESLAGLPHAGEVCCVFSNDERIAALNEKFRHKAGPTNVLSFPAPPAIPGQDADETLGDVVLAFETIESESESQQKPFTDHLSHLIVHGLLHLLGYDHETDADAEAMESIEVEILRAMGITNPYLARQPAMESAQ